MNRNGDKYSRRVLWMGVFAALLAGAAAAAELTPQTSAAFDRYTRAREAQIAGELKEPGKFFWFDKLSPELREKMYERLRHQEIIIERRETRDGNQAIKIPEGMVHHWMGAAFLPGSTLAQVLAVVQDYNHHQEIYRPDVRRSKLESRDENKFRVWMQLYKKTIVTTAMDVQFEVQYFKLDASHVYSQSHSTRIAEVGKLGEPGEYECTVGLDHGYLWRLYSYWRFQEKDGGVYVQVESIGLTRDVPEVVAMIVRPLISRIPRETLGNLLVFTRNEVMKRNAPAGKAAERGPQNIAMQAAKRGA